MRTGKVTIDGKEYTIVRSLWASSKIEELPRDMGSIRAGMTIMAILLQAGYKLDKKNGEEPPQPPTLEELMEYHDDEDLAAWNPMVKAVMRGDRHVLAEPPKKKESLPEA